MNISLTDTAVLAQKLHLLIQEFTEPRILKRLKLRVKEAIDKDEDEITQFRCLQKACEESRDLGRALATSGFGIVATLDTRSVSSETGRLIQAFNYMVENLWEE